LTDVPRNKTAANTATVIAAKKIINNSIRRLSSVARMISRSVRDLGSRSSMKKHDVANHAEAEDYRREPDRFDEV
jgi:hypothetical protein